jgi:hypothetical protein
MNLTIETSSDFKKIYVKSDSNTANTDYPVMEVYINNVKIYTLVVSGSATIDSVAYTTTTNANNLNFATTTTTIGTEYIHTISNDTLGNTADTVLTNGVWSFKLLDNAATTNLFIGDIVHDNIDCCIMNNLDEVCNGNCNLDKIIKDTNNIRGLLYSAKISAKKAEFTNAICKYQIAETLCEKCI